MSVQFIALAGRMGPAPARVLMHKAEDRNLEAQAGDGHDCHPPLVNSTSQILLVQRRFRMDH
jgi:hypothetical protein